MESYVKLFRKFRSWGWYADSNTKAVFIHCLLKANITAGEWQGIHYDAGEFITSIPTLCQELGLTAQNVRTSINHLISTGEITVSLTDKVTGKKISKGRIITVNKWGDYQATNRQDNRQVTDDLTGIQQASNRQVTAGEEYKEYKENKEDKNIYSRNKRTDYQQITDLFHETCRSLPKINRMTEQRKAKIRNLLRQYTVDDFETVFRKAEASDFLSGRSGKWTSCSFDWLIKPSNFLKTIEGVYDNNDRKEVDAVRGRSRGQPGSKFNNSSERNYDMDDLEKRLLASN